MNYSLAGKIIFTFFGGSIGTAFAIILQNKVGHWCWITPLITGFLAYFLYDFQTTKKKSKEAWKKAKKDLKTIQVKRFFKHFLLGLGLFGPYFLVTFVLIISLFWLALVADKNLTPYPAIGIYILSVAFSFTLILIVTFKEETSKRSKTAYQKHIEDLKRVFKDFNIITILKGFFGEDIPYLVTVIIPKFFTKVIPKAAWILWRIILLPFVFIWFLAKLIHSENRLLIANSIFFGTAIGLYSGYMLDFNRVCLLIGGITSCTLLLVGFGVRALMKKHGHLPLKTAK